MQRKRKVWKHHLPSYYPLTRYRFDITKLREATLDASDYFTDVFQSNSDLCKNNPELTDKVYDHYEQVSLTKFNGASAPVPAADLTARTSMSRTQEYRQKIGKRFDNPQMDERNYNLPTELYSGSHFEACVSQFNAAPMRVRLVKLKPGKVVDFHIDYDPSFSVRIVVPVFTNEHVWNYTKRGNELEKIHLPADGTPWFLNTGFSHSAVNEGDSERIILMFSLVPDSLLDEISKSWKSGKPALDA